MLVRVMKVWLNVGCGPTDLGITKSNSPDPVIAGNMLTYTIVVTNSGPDTAVNVQVVDTLPAGVTPTGVMMTNLGNIGAGGSVSFMMTVTVNSDTLGVITKIWRR